MAVGGEVVEDAPAEGRRVRSDVEGCREGQRFDGPGLAMAEHDHRLARDLIGSDHDAGLAGAHTEPHGGADREIDDRHQVAPGLLVHPQTGGDDHVATGEIAGEVLGRDRDRDAAYGVCAPDDQRPAPVVGEGPTIARTGGKAQETGVLGEPAVGDGDTPGAVVNLVDDSGPVISGEKRKERRHDRDPSRY